MHQTLLSGSLPIKKPCHYNLGSFSFSHQEKHASQINISIPFGDIHFSLGIKKSLLGGRCTFLWVLLVPLRDLTIFVLIINQVSERVCMLFYSRKGQILLSTKVSHMWHCAVFNFFIHSLVRFF